MSAADENIFTFKDKRLPSDAIHHYSPELKSNKTPLIIDNGSYTCKAGWVTDESPRMTFKNLMAKQRSKKDTEFQIGNDISNIEVVRWLLKTQFDRNVVTQYEVQEQIFDHLFTHLGIDTEGCVEHPIILTEPVCNPGYCRQQMSELLFECYQVPSVFYGVDALFSYYGNKRSPEPSDSLIVSFGHCTTHLLPLLNGRLDASRCRRINIGGSHMTSFMHRLLQLKYPGHFAAITLSRAEEIIQDHCLLKTPYLEQLAKWRDVDYYEHNVHKFQLPFTAQPSSLVSAEQLQERRQQRNKKMREIAVKRREEKLSADQEKLTELMSIQELIGDEDNEDGFYRALDELGYTKPEELQESISRLSASIERTRAKILGIEVEPEPVEKEDPVYDLLDVPDDELTEEQVKLKRRQRILKNAAEGRARAQKLRQEKRVKEQEEERKMDEKRQKDFNGWLKDIHQKRSELLEKREQRRQRKSDMAKRRTYASQQRMKIISQLAETKKRKKEDTFGQNEDDWNVYKEIQKDGNDSDSDTEQDKLEEYEALLREHDEEFEKENTDQGGAATPFDLAEYYRLHIGIERIRVPELMFQPSQMGLPQAGVSETMEFMLTKFNQDQQNRLMGDVFLTGSPAAVPGLKERLEADLLAMRPFQSRFKVREADNPGLGSWLGAKKWATSANFNKYCVTRKDYDEYGGNYLKECEVTNNLVTVDKS